jgi:hypothetical protein
MKEKKLLKIQPLPKVLRVQAIKKHFTGEASLTIFDAGLSDSVEWYQADSFDDPVDCWWPDMVQPWIKHEHDVTNFRLQQMA